MQAPTPAFDAATVKMGGPVVNGLINTWVMHTKSTPRDDSARLVAGRQ
jgi:hypothetical protein